MKKIIIPTTEQVILTNKMICERAGNPHACPEPGKVESALFTAFYPETYPFAVGGIASTAGALCFYLVKAHAFTDGNKRTGTLVAIVFMEQNGWTLEYPVNPKKNTNALAEVVERCAASQLKKEELMDWFDGRKKRV